MSQFIEWYFSWVKWKTLDIVFTPRIYSHRMLFVHISFDRRFVRKVDTAVHTERVAEKVSSGREWVQAKWLMFVVTAVTSNLPPADHPLHRTNDNHFPFHLTSYLFIMIISILLFKSPCAYARTQIHI